MPPDEVLEKIGEAVAGCRKYTYRRSLDKTCWEVVALSLENEPISEETVQVVAKFSGDEDGARAAAAEMVKQSRLETGRVALTAVAKYLTESVAYLL